MAKDNAKKAIKSNEKRIQIFLIITASINVFHVVWRSLRGEVFQWYHDLGWALLIVSEVIPLKILHSISRPEYDDEGRLESCTDLSNITGLPSYIQDVLWVSWFVHFTTLFSNWFWWFYLSIPIYGAYIFYNNLLRPYLLFKNSMSDPGDATKNNKKMSKRELREQKKENTKSARGSVRK